FTVLCSVRLPPPSTLFPYTTLFRSIRKTWRGKNLPIGVIGEQSDLTYDYTYLGEGFETLVDLAAGNGSFAETLANAQRPLIIVGDRKSTRLNSSHVKISYAVFCLKK